MTGNLKQRLVKAIALCLPRSVSPVEMLLAIALVIELALLFVGAREDATLVVGATTPSGVHQLHQPVRPTHTP